jgi:FAS-associated factor 2
MQALLTEKLGARAPGVFVASFLDALARSRDAHHMLLVLLHSELHEDAEEFVTNTLGDQAVGSAIAEGPFTFWAASATSKQGQRAARACQASEYPFLCVLVSTSPTADKYDCVARCRGHPDPQRVLAWLGSVRERWGPRLEARRAELVARDMDRMLKEEQEREYKEAEEADRRKLDAAEAADLAKQEDARRAREAEAREEEAQLLTQALSLSVEDQVRCDAAAAMSRLAPEPGPTEPGLAHIRLTFPGGTVVERRFRADEPQRMIRDYVSVVLHKLQFVEFAGFSLVCRAPSRTLQPGQDPRSIEEAGLTPSARVFVALEDTRSAEEIARESIRRARAGDDVDQADGGGGEGEGDADMLHQPVDAGDDGGEAGIGAGRGGVGSGATLSRRLGDATVSSTPEGAEAARAGRNTRRAGAVQRSGRRLSGRDD